MKTLQGEADYLIGAATATWSESQRMGISLSEYVNGLIESYVDDGDAQDLFDIYGDAWQDLLVQAITEKLE